MGGATSEIPLRENLGEEGVKLGIDEGETVHE